MTTTTTNNDISMAGAAPQAARIRNVLFDLGGVIMDIRRCDCVAALRRLGMEHPEAWLGDYVQAGPFAALESGAMSPAEFRAALRPLLRQGVTDEEIDAALMKFLIGIPRCRLEELRSLRRRGYRLGLLSNTNPIMWDGRITEEFRQEGLSGPEAYFDGMVRSYKAGVMKPDPEIFRLAARELEMRPEQTLFVDDSEANLEAAAREGFMTLLAGEGDDFVALLEERLAR